MLDILQVVKALVCFQVSLLVCITTGYLLNAVVKKLYNLTGNVPAYWLCFSGLFLWVSIYASILTHGLTILLPVPILLFYIHKALLNNNNNHNQSLAKEYLFLFIAGLVQFAFYVWTFVSFNSESYQFVSGDFSIYYRMAQRLNVYRIEAYNFNLDLSLLKAPSAYHFGDLWFYAIVIQFFKGNPTFTFIIAFSLLSVIFTTGLYTFSVQLFKEHLARKRGYLYLLIFAGLFSGFQYSYPSFLLKYSEPYTLSVFNWGKVLVLAVTLIGVLILIRNRNFMALSLMSVISGLLYINAAPAIFVSLFLLLVINLFKKRINIKEWFSYHVVYIGVTAAMVLFLYKLWPAISGNQNRNTVEIEHTFLNGKSVGTYIKTAINIFIGGWFQVFTVLPYLFVLFIGLWILNKRRNLLSVILKADQSVLFLILMFVSGLGCWAVLHPVAVDTVQFFHNILAPIYAIAISLIMLFVILKVAKPVLSVIILILVIFSSYISSTEIFYSWKFNKQDWKKLEYYFKNTQENHPFVNLKSMQEFKYWSLKKTDQYIHLVILYYRWPDYNNVCLNTPFIPVDSNSLYNFEEQKDVNSSTYSMFYNHAKKTTMNTDDDIAIKFINQYNVHYITVSADTTLPAYIRPLVKDSLVLSESHCNIYRIK